MLNFLGIVYGNYQKALWCNRIQSFLISLISQIVKVHQPTHCSISLPLLSLLQLNVFAEFQSILFSPRVRLRNDQLYKHLN